MIERLRDGNYTVIGFDAPAHGYSSGRMLNGPLYAACLRQVIDTYLPKNVIGHSFGGMAMIYGQYTHPNPHIERMVTLGSPAELTDFMAQYQTTFKLGKRLMLALNAHFKQQFGMDFVDFSTPRFSVPLRVKGLLVHDELDGITAVQCSENVHTNWKGSILVKTKGLGHSLHQESVQDRVLDFLRS